MGKPNTLNSRNYFPCSQKMKIGEVKPPPVTFFNPPFGGRSQENGTSTIALSKHVFGIMFHWK